MKKPVVIWIIAALFLLCSFPLFAEGNIGAGVCGIVIAAALAAFGYVKMKKGQAAAEEVKQAEAATLEAEESPYEFVNTKIVGVTFKDGRKNRQTVLRRLHWKDEPFDKNEAEVILDREEYEGKPAYAVLLNGEKAGYVPAELAQYIADNSDRCDGVTHIDTYCGHDDIYGAKIVIRFRKV